MKEQLSKNLIKREKYQRKSIFGDAGIIYGATVKYRLLRKLVSAYIRRQKKQKFIKILVVTTEAVEYDFISALQKQYPDKMIEVIKPMLGEAIPGEKLCGSFEFFAQNKTAEALLYKMPQNKDNITVYEIYSPMFSNVYNIKEFSKIQYLLPFLKCVRYYAKKLKPDIIQSNYIPFYMGAEFEYRMDIPVVQLVRSLSEYNNIEPFWAILNMVDKKGMKKLCRDKTIIKYVSALFNKDCSKNSNEMRICLDIIYQNYMKFRSVIKEGDNSEESVYFAKLNLRAAKLFPQIKSAGFAYNPMLKCIRESYFWAVLSETFYNEIFEGQRFSEILTKYKEKSNYVLVGREAPIEGIAFPIDLLNFRENKSKNKKYLIKEFSSDRIQTKFTDLNLLKSEEVKIYGYLDAFYNSALFFMKCDEMDEKTTQIAINAILKMFELNKNIQIIIYSSQGELNNYIKSFVEFCEKHLSLDGRWILIDGQINEAQFYAASDIIMLPFTKNTSELPHLTSIKYGCVPVTFRKGIYNDTIEDIFDNILAGTGFKADASIENTPEEAYLNVVLKALSFYFENSSGWNLLIKNGINSKTGWTFEIIEKYNSIYEKILY